MALTRYRRRSTDWDPFASLFDLPEIYGGRMLDFPRFFGRRGMPITWHPSVDMYEDNEKFLVRMDLPGMSKDDVNISFDGHVLSITGHREEEKLKDDSCYWSRERFSGDFHRYVHVPAEVKSEDLRAKFKDGVLEIALPKVEKTGAKKIAIESGEEAK